MSTLQMPCVHLNGTGRETLVEGYMEARHKVMDAIEAIRKIEFNPRDYYVLEDVAPGAWNRAREQHIVRLLKLEEIAEELLAIAAHCQEGRA